MILRSKKYSASPKSGALFLQNIALSALAGGVIFNILEFPRL